MTGHELPERDGLPEELAELDHLLREIRFQPRASLGPEIAGRARREAAAPPPPGRRRAPLAIGLGLAALALGAAAAVIAPWRGVSRGAIDRCCFDLDGGGEPDDGVVIVVARDGRVARLTIYEDRDRDGRRSPRDPVRYRSGGGSDVAGPPPLPHGLVTLARCCGDYDRGGLDDDGILVVGAPPDRVFLAMIYEDRDGDGVVSATDVVRYPHP